ncbi:bifunctional 4-hydroxy-2-oxoglutarate aldolase/2-dehydro-3-deoxy-phosphogluconate aldolase [Gracilibacillus salitolerans]|uniref:Bifunctional 4-hydroxy-2-oxoglutarate aldolase/2-dehydro-3-deoxy-phosphogluconate aldolase n=1 Tax=Gracilibacillus salitolerans TaxID=2663022 RepID=A0A5Q2TQT2_9BACI|nr:bifunctional 2-keto-4-hydroxyglutarate aldolase/2-keto-3-deoxy-6-phosphogluconate aldolase [Gracilibacillus salitolerans]QGH36551.1 bifunctional 4-hydroxy-2-oxoglutarate aldolase/2-dehydro-3-deoxy-phosphogluconate aldolase [Gracilibacillus salitolerans]
MKKLSVLQNLEQQKVVAVIRTDSVAQAIKVADACIAGGMKQIELTYSIPNVENAVEQLQTDYQDDSEVTIGVGTVLDAYTARQAIFAGASFIVGPSFDADTAKLCNLYQVPYFPGCLTVTEVKEAMEAGADIVKIFPGSNISPGFIKAVHGPVPQANMMPTGGVSLDNIQEWLKNGAIVVGVGGNLVAPAKEGNYQKITELAKEYMAKAREVSI